MSDQNIKRLDADRSVSASSPGPESLQAIAKRLFWWQEPEVSLSNSPRFLMQVMTLGTDSEVEVAEKTFGRDAMRDALCNADPGVFDPKSWSYWHLVFGIPMRPLPGGSLK